MSKKKLLKKKNNREKKSHFWDLDTETKKSIWGIVFLALTLLAILSFFGKAGILGYYFSKGSKFLFGFGFFLIPASFIFSAISLFKNIYRKRYAPTILGIFIFLFSFLGLIEIFSSGSGGFFGNLVSLPVKKFTGFWAGATIFVTGLFISFLVLFNFSLKRVKSDMATHDQSDDKEDKETLSKNKILGKIGEFAKNTFNKQNNLGSTGAVPMSEKEQKEHYEQEKESFSDSGLKPFKLSTEYKAPSLDLLEGDSGTPSSGDIKVNANIIQRTLENFGIEVEMGEVNIGPTITQFTLKPAEGVKLSKITALSNNLAMALAAHPIRIEAPIPGRPLVGIEIPNKKVSLVRLKSLLGSSSFKNYSSRLGIILGRDVMGTPIFADLKKMPHLLVAGSTGAGKSVCIHSIITSLIYRNSPEIIKFLLVDPKRVELPTYDGIPHLIAPVITDHKKTINSLRWATREMEKRYEVLSEAKVRDIDGYNDYIQRKKTADLMPYIVIIIDELADIMTAFPREVEASIIRLAQMARAVGIHLIVSTQRPSIEVITGLIKANITSRIAFQMASQVDSRTILDLSGAEKLLGNGDMLYISSEFSKPKRIQGVFASEKEVKRVVDYLKKDQSFQEESLEKEILEAGGSQSENSASLFDGFDDVSADELYEDAKRVVVEAKKASASLLQRRLRVGYARAARLIDMLEEKGVVGPGEGAKPRELLIGQDYEEERSEMI